MMTNTITILVDHDCNESVEFCEYINNTTPYVAKISDSSNCHYLMSDEENKISNELWEEYCRS